ncbi:MAG: DnaB-like helicase C-terminal domain-containing protein, partial [bacterium]
APIYIDDVASSNVIQMRAMARRLAMDKGLGLLIIDYLQLMEGRGNIDNIVQQVSENSRALKSIAKELNIPVLVLSQLSRAVEHRMPPVPRLSDLRESGCLTGDTLITRADTGERIPIKDLVGQTDIPVHSLDFDFKIKEKLISKVFSTGEKMVYEMTTRSGFKIKASSNHPFWRIDGWKRLNELKPGDRIATPAEIKISRPKNELTENEVILLAHLLGDGCILPKQPYHYTSADWENIKIVEKTAKDLFNINSKIIKQKNWWHIYLTCPYPLTHNKQHPITKWFEELGIKRVRSYEKQIPQKIFSLDNKRLALFLKHLWATDGNISLKPLRKEQTQISIYYSSTSYQIAQSVKNLLLKFGIRSKISEKHKGNYRACYMISVYGKEHQLKFLETIGCYGERGKKIPQFIEKLNNTKSNTNLDVWPKEIWKFVIDPIRKHQGMSWREFSKGIETRYCGDTLFKSGISTERMTRIAKTLESPILWQIAQSDIFWDEIVSIKQLGTEEVFDATVPGTHNFVADGIILENSIEQDADVVMFIYREDKYKPNTERKNVAEIIVAKHRNGPVGKIELYFDETRVTFRDMEKGSYQGADTEEEESIL